MKRLFSAFLAFFLAAAVAVILIALPFQRPPAPLDFPSVLPPSPLVYLESQDFLGQLQRWNTSPAKRDWLSSANYRQFLSSRLLLRLNDKLTQFNSLLGLTIDLPLVQSLAGSRAGLALYDIGELEFVFITQVPSPAFEQGTFFSKRPQFEQRSAGNGNYLVKSGQGQQLAFALQDGYFLLATSERLLRTTLYNLANPNSTERLNLDSEFSRSTSLLERQTDLWMFLNLDRLNRSRYFHNEWLYGRSPKLSRLRVGAVRITLGESRFLEERRFTEEEESGSAAPSSSNLDKSLLRSIPSQVEFVNIETASPDQLAEQLYSTLISPLRPRDQALPFFEAPDYAVAPLLKTDNVYFQRIDTPLSEAPDSQPDTPRAIRVRRLSNALSAGGIISLARCESPVENDQGYHLSRRAFIFPAQPSAVVTLKRTLADLWNELYYATKPAVWASTGNGVETLGPLSPLSLAQSDGRVYVGNSEPYLASILKDTGGVPSDVDSVPLERYARVNLDSWRSHALPLFRWLDYQEQPPPEGAPPPYFSENLGSLLAALSPIQAVTARTWTQDKLVAQQVVYELHP
ncbi:MAG: hypothetical protein AB1898_01680 [Acidobacteriota bacterium]